MIQGNYTAQLYRKTQRRHRTIQRPEDKHGARTVAAPSFKDPGGDSALQKQYGNSPVRDHYDFT